MPIYDIHSYIHITRHGYRRMHERSIQLDEVTEALSDGSRVRRAGGRWEVRGRNGITVVLNANQDVVVTVLPRGARPHLALRDGIGGNRHRRRPDGRRQQQRPFQSARRVQS